MWYYFKKIFSLIIILKFCSDINGIRLNEIKFNWWKGVFSYVSNVQVALYMCMLRRFVVHIDIDDVSIHFATKLRY